MKNSKYILCSILCVFCVDISFAQLTFSGEFRPRTEVNHGVFTLADEDQKIVVFTEQRTRLNLEYSALKFRTKLVLQDVRAWGSTPQLAKADNFSALHEAWAEVLFNKKVSLKVGRQELSYDDHRILGNVGWAQQARSHDLALLKIEGELKAHIGIAHNTNNTSPTNLIYALTPGYKAMQFLWLHHAANNFKVSFLALNNGIQQVKASGTTLINYSQTIGPRLAYQNEKLGGNLTFYYQTGKTEVGTELAAYNLMAELSFKVSQTSSFIIGYERLSGTDQINPADDKNHSFFPFYGTNHKFNGLIDYFYVGNHANNVGLQDFFTKLKLKYEKHSGGIDLHYFTSAADLVDPQDSQNALSKNLGTEVDIYWTYTVDKNISLSVGYAQMFGTTSMEALKGGNKSAASYWGWMMLTVKPTFLKRQKEQN